MQDIDFVVIDNFISDAAAFGGKRTGRSASQPHSHTACGNEKTQRGKSQSVGPLPYAGCSMSAVPHFTTALKIIHE
ncbi:MAG: hypothetical protein PHU14_12485 [Methylovulum sp.]|nr:hypothetical protein [Methylovulum sp.]